MMTRPLTTYRRAWAIHREGVCDGCGRHTQLKMAYEVDYHNEPWLCAACVREQPVPCNYCQRPAKWEAGPGGSVTFRACGAHVRHLHAMYGESRTRPAAP